MHSFYSPDNPRFFSNKNTPDISNSYTFQKLFGFMRSFLFIFYRARFFVKNILKLSYFHNISSCFLLWYILFIYRISAPLFFGLKKILNLSANFRTFYHHFCRNALIFIHRIPHDFSVKKCTFTVEILDLECVLGHVKKSLIN